MFAELGQPDQHRSMTSRITKIQHFVPQAESARCQNGQNEVTFCGGDSSQFDRIQRIDGHANGDRFAVQQAMIRQRFHTMC